MDDVLIIGGGAIGLSLACDLARHGRRVRLVERGAVGQESSWAGAGILPPAVRRPHDHPLEQLAGLSNELHPCWAEQLRLETGIDNGYRRTGGLYIACDVIWAGELAAVAEQWRSRGIAVESVSADDVSRLEPALAAHRIVRACLAPQEAQIRNPRHLKALVAACVRLGVQIEAGIPADDFLLRNGKIEGIATCRGTLRAGDYCICGGAWSGALASRLGVQAAIRPMRGQIALLDTSLCPTTSRATTGKGEALPATLLRRVINEGPRYLVPRDDGQVLVGSTEEDVGFVKENTAADIADLLLFAEDLCPALGSARLVRCWSGLRPATSDSLPYLGRVPGVENGFLAAGHFRQGLHLSPATAVVMSQLIRGETPEVDLEPFAVGRGTTTA